ncbi:MAG: hypothetical protein AAFN81_13260 [Bacteroidota bacterium]
MKLINTLFTALLILFLGNLVYSQTTFRGLVAHAIRVDEGCNYQEPDPPFVPWSGSFLRDAVVRVNTFPTMSRCTATFPYVTLGETCSTTSADFPIGFGGNWECTVASPQNIVQLICSVPGNSVADWQNGVGFDDLSILSLYVNGQQIDFINPFLKIAADVNGDGSIDAGDFAPMNAIINGDAANIPSGSPWQIMWSYLINQGNQASGFNDVFCEDPLSSEIDYPNYLNGRTECGWIGVPRGGWPSTFVFQDAFLAIKRGDLNYNTQGLAPTNSGSKHLVSDGFQWNVQYDQTSAMLSLEISVDQSNVENSQLHGFLIQNESDQYLPLADPRLSKDQLRADDRKQLHWFDSEAVAAGHLTFQMQLPTTNSTALTKIVADWINKVEITPLFRNLEREQELVKAGLIRYNNAEFSADMLDAKSSLFVNAFPNPSFDQRVTLDIQLAEEWSAPFSKAEITFFGIDGRIIQTQTINLASKNHREEFLLPTDHKGLVLWQVKTANNTANGKFVIQ